MKITINAILAFLLISIMPIMALAQDDVLDLENTLYLQLKSGRVVIKMLPEIAPNHVARIKELTRQKFYDGIIFHRVIEGFMAQTGDPDGNGTGGSGQYLDAEFSDRPHYKGMVSMARSSGENSADSQWFICLGYSPHLDGKYTMWGEVVSGMRYVDKIKKGVVPDLIDPDKIITLRVAADVEE